MTEIGKNIMERRKALGMTQEDLASKMGYKSKSTINKIELGRNDIPQSKISKFAEILETTPGALMGWEKIQKKNDIMTDIVIEMRINPEFLSLVETLYSLDSEKRNSVKQMLAAFCK